MRIVCQYGKYAVLHKVNVLILKKLDRLIVFLKGHIFLPFLFYEYLLYCKHNKYVMLFDIKDNLSFVDYRVSSNPTF